MPAEHMTARLAATRLDQMSERELRAALAAMIDAMRVVTAKLDADAGVTDTNYTALFDAVILK